MKAEPKRIRETLRSFALSLGVDDVGFASVDDYRSPASPAFEIADYH